jgi:hypothetical protein
MNNENSAFGYLDSPWRVHKANGLFESQSGIRASPDPGQQSSVGNVPIQLLWCCLNPGDFVFQFLRSLLVPLESCKELATFFSASGFEIETA